jgi:hypothetical protein
METIQGKLCSFCGEKEIIENYSSVPRYQSPFDKEPEIEGYCSDECLDHSESSSWGDFTYQWCDSCERSIIQRCPSNGWHEYFRYSENGATCLQCYQDDLIENGVKAESFENGEINGMFFDDGDLKKAHYQNVGDFYLGSDYRVNDYCSKALWLIKRGFKVITNYESLSICGTEGHVSLWIKRGNHARNVKAGRV